VAGDRLTRGHPSTELLLVGACFEAATLSNLAFREASSKDFGLFSSSRFISAEASLAESTFGAGIGA